ncbi:putative WD repeat-containing protein 44-like [Cocos nucifera]|uniref:Putative WD repeat-containing protein 44-like n=1 Tax=Cocos nucifera TaxID=13894 RepID=A0A8K0IMU5_COCNU|nr:putative WD repeat-containing protein 44-like [Cocos nucifera]
MNNSEQEEEFYESLDRILWSSCSSTSAFDDDAHPRRRRRHLPRFPPPSAVSLDVWISEPASVEERRQRLLQQLGLAGDPALARRKAPTTDGPIGGARTREGDIGRSVSCDGLCPRPASASSAAAAIGRSRSAGSVDPGDVYDHQQQLHQRSFPVSGKPPLVGRTRPASVGNLDGDEDPRCLIRNLDNGCQFVVKEFREDGMWNKLREVGTGRQLTIEEFEMCVGRSPIVQELMRRQKVVGSSPPGGAGSAGGMTSKKRGSWLRSIKNVAGSVVAGCHHRDRHRSNDKGTSSEKGGRMWSSAIDDSQDGSHSVHRGPERTKVRQYGKSQKELTGLFMSQEIQAHNGSIWTIKFSLDGRYLASAGEDCVIHVWEVTEYERKGELLEEEEDNGSCNPFVSSIINGSPEPTSSLACVEGHHSEKKRRAKVPVTCIQFNPIDDRYFISGSLDEKVRIWSIPDRQIVDWNDLHEMVTAACYTPDGQIINSFKNVKLTCKTRKRNPVTRKSLVSRLALVKLKGVRRTNPNQTVQGMPNHIGGIPYKVLASNSEHRRKERKSFRNRSSQISACVTTNGKYVICASEDSHVYVWNYDDDSRPSRSKAIVAVTECYEHFHCRDVTAAVPWPNTITGGKLGMQCNGPDVVSKAHSQTLDEANGHQHSLPGRTPSRYIDTNTANHGDKVSATWPEELMAASKQRLHLGGFRNRSSQISACVTTNGKYVICASEDSHVYVWNYDDDSRPSRSKAIVAVTECYEHFHCRDVTAAVPWPNTITGGKLGMQCNGPDVVSKAHSQTLDEANGHQHSLPGRTPSRYIDTNTANHGDKVSATWPEELMAASKQRLHLGGMPRQSRAAWGLVIVTAHRRGEIRTFQNFGFSVRI